MKNALIVNVTIKQKFQQKVECPHHYRKNRTKNGERDYHYHKIKHRK